MASIDPTKKAEKAIPSRLPIKLPVSLAGSMRSSSVTCFILKEESLIIPEIVVIITSTLAGS